VLERRNDAQVINWDKRLSEDFGLIKMDILGLSTLDMMEITRDAIQGLEGKRVDLLRIPLDDAPTLAAFGRGETIGVFQFESHGMRRLLRDLATTAPLTFDDLAVATALYRPGPMDSGLMDDFVKIRQGFKDIRYDHPSMEEALRETSGVMIYQEQVMRVARDFAGFTLPEADGLRKAMGKKDAAKMATFREKFVEGAVKTHDADPTLAVELYEKIAKFASYGFNKSHAVEYALISYQAMYLKVHHPVCFWAGVLTMIKEERRPATLTDMQRMGIKLLPPDINASSEHFAPMNSATLIAPFGALKGLTQRTAKAIIETRETGAPFHIGVPLYRLGRFASLAEFEKRVAGRACNSKQRDILDRVGAFARIEPGQIASDHPDRRRDQVELMPGLVMENVIVDREIDVQGANLDRLIETVKAWKSCDRCALAAGCHPRPRLKHAPKAMFVVDHPNFREEAADEMGAGSAAEAIDQALAALDMGLDDIYLTSLIKTLKPKGDGFPNKTLSECPVWLEEEIRILRPPVIVVLGSLTFKHFFPGQKGGINEHAGRIQFDKGRDCNLLVGINPNAIHFDPSKQDLLNGAVEKLSSVMPF
jgi:DNA polymerase-3 subunit alpha